MRCGCGFTVAAAAAPLLRGPRKLWDRLTADEDSPTKWRFRRIHFWFSLVLFLTILSVFEKAQPDKWIASALHAVIFLPLLFVLVVWLKPKPKPRKATKSVPSITKIALLINYFTFLLVLELTAAAWLGKAVIIAVQCAVTLVAWFVFVWFYPVWVAMGWYFQQQTTQAEFDPTDYQGKRARSDGGRRSR